MILMFFTGFWMMFNGVSLILIIVPKFSCLSFRRFLVSIAPFVGVCDVVSPAPWGVRCGQHAQHVRACSATADTKPASRAELTKKQGKQTGHEEWRGGGGGGERPAGARACVSEETRAVAIGPPGSP